MTAERSTRTDGAVAISLAERPTDLATWRAALLDSRAGRVTLATTLTDVTPGAPHPVVATRWYVDEGSLERDAIDLPGATTVVAVPEVRRGVDWLDARWRDGGPRYKHMALARRVDGLTREEFGERWRAHAGSVGSTPIPEVARGQAYVQNHPVDGDWAFDAITEVWFDDLDHLRRRAEWMEEALADGPGDLFGAHQLFAVREELL